MHRLSATHPPTSVDAESDVGGKRHTGGVRGLDILTNVAELEAAVAGDLHDGESEPAAILLTLRLPSPSRSGRTYSGHPSLKESPLPWSRRWSPSMAPHQSRSVNGQASGRP